MEGPGLSSQNYNDNKKLMRRKIIINREDGFTLVELIITMLIFVLIMAAASGVFTGLLTQFKQQSKIAETNVEGIVGLEILKQDLEQAGYGLPWNLNGASYQEAAVDSLTSWVDFNDGPPNNPARGTDPAGCFKSTGGCPQREWIRIDGIIWNRCAGC